MNAFNRTFLALYSLLWIAACAGLAALAWNDDQKLDFSLGTVNLQAFILSEDTDRWIFTAILALLGLVGLITLLTAFRRSSDVSKGYVRLQAADGGVVDVSAAAVEALIRTELESLPQVRQASATVRVSGGAIQPDLTVSIDPGAHIADTTHVITERTAIVLREQLGATRVRRPVLHLTYDEIAARAAGRARPLHVAPPQGNLPPPPPEPAPQPAAPPPMPAPPHSASDPLPEPPRNSHEAPTVIMSPTVHDAELPPPPPGDDAGDRTLELPPDDVDPGRRPRPEYENRD